MAATWKKKKKKLQLIFNQVEVSTKREKVWVLQNENLEKELVDLLKRMRMNNLPINHSERKSN